MRNATRGEFQLLHGRSLRSFPNLISGGKYDGAYFMARNSVLGDDDDECQPPPPTR